MKITNKKIISMILLIIIFATQLSTVLSADYNDGTEHQQTLTEYLVKNGLDTNGDNQIIGDEWLKIKNLELINIDLTGIENAVNLKTLVIKQCYNFAKIDLSKLTNLENLTIHSTYEICNYKIPTLPNLKYLNLSLDEIKSLDLKELENIERLQIYSPTLEKLELPKFTNLEGLDLYVTKLNYSTYTYESLFSLDELDLSKCANLYYGKIVGGKPTQINNIKLNNKLLLIEEKNYNGDILEVSIGKLYDDKIYVAKGSRASVFNGIYPKNEVYTTNETEKFNFIEEKNQYDYVFRYVEGKEVGTGIITVTDYMGKTKDIVVEVFESKNNIDIDKTLDNNNITTEILLYDQILKSNGELWRVNSESTAEIIDTNVKKKVIGQVYYNDQYSSNYIENTLKTNNNLTINVGGNKKEVQDVIDMNENVYLTTKGDLYEVGFNYITEEIKPKKIMSNVKKILNECIVTNDNITYCQDDYNYLGSGVTFRKLADFEIQNVKTVVYNAVYDDRTYPKDARVVEDNNGILWGCFANNVFTDRLDSSYTLKKFELEYEILDNYRVPENLYYSGDTIELKNDNIIINRKNSSEILLDNVTSLSGSLFDRGTFICTRKDGSIWTYNEKKGLTKITKSTPSIEEPIPPTTEEKYLEKTATVQTKDIVGDIDVVSGLKENTTVNEVIINFKKDFTVKVFDTYNNEISSTDKVGTGYRVVLYNQSGDEIKSYFIVIYGDTDGSGTVTAIDALGVIKDINNKIKFKNEAFKEAARVRSQSAEQLSAVDALAIIKSLNGKFTINQDK